MKNHQKLESLGFSLEQGPTIFGKRKDWSASITANTQVKLHLRGLLVYDGPYSRGLGHFPDFKEPLKPSGIFTLREYWEMAEKYAGKLARFEELAPIFLNRLGNYAQALIKKGEESDAKEYLSLVAETLRDKPEVLTSELCYPLRQKTTREWFSKAIAAREKSAKDLEDYEKKLAEWREGMEGKTVDSPVSLEDVVYSTVMDATDETFRDFCESFGYDYDSRKAFKTWQKCRAIHKRIDEETLEKAREILA